METPRFEDINPTKYHTLLSNIFPIGVEIIHIESENRVYICSIHSQNFLKTQIERVKSRIRRHHRGSDIEIERLHIIDLFV